MIRHLNIFTWQLILWALLHVVAYILHLGTTIRGVLYIILGNHSVLFVAWYLFAVLFLQNYYMYKVFIDWYTLRYVVDMTLRGDRLLMSKKIFLTKDLVKSHNTMSMIYICLFFMSPSLLWKGNYDPQEHAVRLNKS